MLREDLYTLILMIIIYWLYDERNRRHLVYPHWPTWNSFQHLEAVNELLYALDGVLDSSLPSIDSILTLVRVSSIY